MLSNSRRPPPANSGLWIGIFSVASPRKLLPSATILFLPEARNSKHKLTIFGFAWATTGSFIAWMENEW